MAGASVLRLVLGYKQWRDAVKPAVDSISPADRLFEGFEDLMPFRVQDILLVSSPYDAFILREDGRLNEVLSTESFEFHLQGIPRITHVPSGADALELVRTQPRFNLIVANLTVGDTHAAQLAREIREVRPEVPVVVLAYDYREVKAFVARRSSTEIDRVFLWEGDGHILPAIVTYVEDKRNAPHDAGSIGVPVILVVEDNVRYYSSFLPVIYTELITQSRRVIGEGISAAHKMLRLRARPKILLSSHYEDAVQQVLRYKESLFALVSDVEFPRGGELSPDAGFELALTVREVAPDIPILLQSSRTEFRARARREGFSFLRKRSPTLLRDLRRFLVEECGFGDFVFRLPNRTEVGRAGDLNALEKLLREVPAESIAYHGQRNHFSHWLMARTEFAVAQKLRPRKVSDFASHEELRRDLIESIAEHRREQSRLLVGDFHAASFQPSEPFFLRIGGGSLGGKARGLAFVRYLLHKHGIEQRFRGVRILVPPAVVLATAEFDSFLDENDLADFSIRSADDAEMQQRFLAARLPKKLEETLESFAEAVRYPLAVRSSSLLEDAQYQPFAGVYETFMLANRHREPSARLAELAEAIKLVYASTFSQHAKAFVRATPYRLEEERMAVMLQQVVGATHGNRFYPDFSGVARSRNFYPVGPMRSEDGIVVVALGLGRAVVEGGKCLTFCPRYPRHLVQFSSVEDILANSQTDFWALELVHTTPHADPVANLREVCFGLNVAEEDGTLAHVASVYSADNHAVYDGLSRPGTPIVSFAPILKAGIFPLAPILMEVLKIAEDGFGRAVEIEFACRLPASPDEIADFAVLQVRPQGLWPTGEGPPMDEADPAQLICRSDSVLGNGQIRDLRDIVVVDTRRFERARSGEVARSVAQLNARLVRNGIPYLLIGVGRWGSKEPWLGIPVEWDDIAGARAIIESGFHDFRVVPSQGSHFFQNLAAFQVGYFTVNPDAGEGFVDWQWLEEQAAVEELGCVRHLRFSAPFLVVMNGKDNRGAIFKPESPSSIPVSFE